MIDDIMHLSKHRNASITRMWKQFKCPSMNEWISKVWYVLTMGYYATFKKKETWYTLLHELWGHHANAISQSQTNSLCFHLYETLIVIKFIQTESRMEASKGCEKGKWGVILFKEYSFSFARWKELCRWVGVMAAKYKYTQYHLTTHPKVVKAVNITVCVPYHNKKLEKSIDMYDKEWTLM